MSANEIPVRRTTGERVVVKVPDGPYYFVALFADDGDESYVRHLLVRAPDRKSAHVVARREARGVELLEARETRLLSYDEVAVLILHRWDVYNA